MPHASDSSKPASGLTVFISYARDDLEFADQLDAALCMAGFTTLIDRQGILGGEDWRQRLTALIRDADTIVFVLSPSSAVSAVCAWEVEEAARLNKRILPVLCRSLSGAVPPPRLAQLNFVHFYQEPRAPGSGFGVGLAGLVRALQTDLVWLREHTRLLQRATEWDAVDRLATRLLSGADVAAAKAWAAQRPAGAPHPTDLHLAYIASSEAAAREQESVERQRLDQIRAAQANQARALLEREAAIRSLSRRTMAGLLGAGSLTAVAGGLAYWGVNAERRFRQAEAEAEAARERSAEREREREAMRSDIEGQMVAYAASPGQFAADGEPGTNSPFTAAVLRELRNSRLPLESALAKARDTIISTSLTHQRPLLSTDLNGPLYLSRTSPTRDAKAVVVSASNGGGKVTLANTKRDGEAWRDFLEGTGFEVRCLIDPPLAEVRRVLAELTFLQTTRHGSWKGGRVWRTGLSGSPGEVPPKPRADTLVVFFYAGAGVARAGDAYMLMGDSVLDRGLDEAADTMLPLKEVASWARRIAAASVLILDTDFAFGDPNSTDRRL